MLSEIIVILLLSSPYAVDCYRFSEVRKRNSIQTYIGFIIGLTKLEENQLPLVFLILILCHSLTALDKMEA